jgi:hypothetical protein
VRPCQSLAVTPRFGPLARLAPLGLTMIDHYGRVRALIDEEPAGADGVQGDLRRLVTAAARGLRAAGVGLTVMTIGGIRGVSAATDPATERLEELQLTMGEGPCIDALNHGHPVLIPRLADGAMSRWPGYAPALYAAGIRAVFAFPLQVGGARLGILDVFHADAGSLPPDDLSLALTFADVAVTTLLDRQQRADPQEGDDGLGDTLGSRATLFQAQGMVMVQLGIPIADALVRIRAHAYAEDRSLGDVAADIVGRRLTFEPEQP